MIHSLEIGCKKLAILINDIFQRIIDLMNHTVLIFYYMSSL